MTEAERLRRAKDEILQTLQETAKRGATPGATQQIISLTSLLQDAEDVESKLSKVTEALSRIEEALQHGIPPDMFDAPNRTRRTTPSKTVSARAHGKILRERFLDILFNEDIEIWQEKGSLFRTQDGDLVGVACATERQPQKWFLGLPDRADYKSMVLICESEDRTAHYFLLPENFCEDYGPRLSRGGDQIKFNLKQSGVRGEVFELTLPGGGRVAVSQYREAWDSLLPFPSKEDEHV